MQYYATPIHMIAPEAPPFIPFSNLKDRADLISLEEARRDPSIVYGGIQGSSRESSMSSSSSVSTAFSVTSETSAVSTYSKASTRSSSRLINMLKKSAAEGRHSRK